MHGLYIGIYTYSKLFIDALEKPNLKSPPPLFPLLSNNQCI